MEVYVVIRDCDVIVGNFSILDIYTKREDAEEHIEKMFAGRINMVAGSYGIKTYTLK